MRVEFLSDEQAAAYGRFNGPPGRAELERYFFLDDVDLALVARRRLAHTRWGFAVRLGTVRYLATFLADLLDVPWPVMECLGGQLDLGDVAVLNECTEREKTPPEHAWEIREALGLHQFTAREGDLRKFLRARAWTRTELFDQGWHGYAPAVCCSPG